MVKATLDTNVLPAQALIERARERGVHATVSSISGREVEQWSQKAEVAALEKVVEVAVLGESRLGEAILGCNADEERLERALAMLSSGSFPPKGNRHGLLAVKDISSAIP